MMGPKIQTYDRIQHIFRDHTSSTFQNVNLLATYIFSSDAHVLTKKKLNHSLFAVKLLHAIQTNSVHRHSQQMHENSTV